MSDPQFIHVDPWIRPIAFRCPLCAALLLNEEDERFHAEWHGRVLMVDAQEHFSGLKPYLFGMNTAGGASLSSAMHPVGAPVAEDAEPAEESLVVEEKESKCKCGAAGTPSHTCPLAEDVNGDFETMCNCCDECESQCCEEI